MGSLTACIALVTALASLAGSAQDASEATALVHELGQFQAEIDGRIQKPTGQPMPVEQRREAIYVKLRALGGAAVPALQRGLTDTDVHPAAREALPLLCRALHDHSNYVRRFAQRAIDKIEPAKP